MTVSSIGVAVAVNLIVVLIEFAISTSCAAAKHYFVHRIVVTILYMSHSSRRGCGRRVGFGRS